MLSLSFSASSCSRRRTCIIKALFSSAAAKDVVSAINDVETLQSQQQPTTRRRTRRRTLASSDIDSSSVINNEIPSLADFMHRAKVLKQYRNFIRLAQYVDDKDTNVKNAPSGKGGECRAALEEVRLSYKLGMKKSVDALAKNMTYSEGERKLRELETMTGYSANKQSKVLEDADTNNITSSPDTYDADSWINIKDEEDTRGRMGVQWPWERD